MSSILLNRSKYKTSQWKNGKGESAEIAICPPEASFPSYPFIWRLSSAKVTEGGPFSEFPGYERYLALVQGNGLRLQFGESKKETLIKVGEVSRFSGYDSVSCELVSGAVTDLNLIFQRDQVKAKFQVLQLSRKPRSFQLEGKITFIFGISGSVAAEVFPGEVKYTIGEGDTLRMDLSPAEAVSEDRLILLDPGKANCMLAFIELD